MAMLLDRWHQNADRVRQAGSIALDLARAAGVPAYYRDPTVGAGIVRHMADGTRTIVDETVEVLSKIGMVTDRDPRGRGVHLCS